MFLGPDHGDFTVCGQGVSTSCLGNSSGPIFMFLVLFGGAGLFGIGAFYRKTTKLILWESALLGYSISLFFDVVILPAAAFPLLPLNGGGILIFPLFLMSIIGIIISAFKYIQTENGGTSETIPELALLTTPKRKKTYSLIPIVGLILAVSLFIRPSIVYGGGWHSCYTHPGRLSFQLGYYSQLVGPPVLQTYRVVQPRQ